MKILIKITWVFIILMSCEKDNTKIDPENLLIGTWVNSGFQDDAYIFLRSPELSNDGPGYIFSEDGNLIERKNSGWCGTPPISYSNYPGTWSVINDTLLQVNSEFWGGTLNYVLSIKSISESELTVSYIFED